MRLADVKRGNRSAAPVRLLLHGPPKIGKSLFASAIPDAICLGYEPGAIEWGTPTFHDDADQPIIFTTWAQTVDAITSLVEEEHGFRAVVVDTVDWLERAVEAEACRRIGIKSMADQAYGNGYAAMADVWRTFTSMLDALWVERKMHIVLLAHSQQVRIQSPNEEPYDAWGLKMGKKGGEILREWAGCIGFARQPVVVTGASKQAKGKSRYSGEREMVVDAISPGILAGNQYGMPGAVDLTWDAFIAAYAAAKGE
jgi:hypothetical protein